MRSDPFETTDVQRFALAAIIVTIVGLGVFLAAGLHSPSYVRDVPGYAGGAMLAVGAILGFLSHRDGRGLAALLINGCLLFGILAVRAS